MDCKAFMFSQLQSCIPVTDPALRGTLFDRPEVTQAALARLTAAGVDARCTVVAGDAFDAAPASGRTGVSIMEAGCA